MSQLLHGEGTISPSTGVEHNPTTQIKAEENLKINI
jgi:hypothetical protein|tara:strand:+ start:264 stop:371 length:108 start_codon:yes stop_codon:yes gene_type:complete